MRLRAILRLIRRWLPDALTLEPLVSGGRMGRKPAMAFPRQSSNPAASAFAKGGRSPACRSNPSIQASGTQAEHQLEKLEFALAVALTRGDQLRSAQLRQQIEALGGNCEEPGT